MKTRFLVIAALLAVAFALVPAAQAATPKPVDVGPTVGEPAQQFRCANGRPLVGPKCRGEGSCLGTDYERTGTCQIRCKTVVGTVMEWGRTATCTAQADTFEGIEGEE